MPVFLQRYLLRQDYMFDNIIEEVAIDHARHIRDSEGENVPYHAERLAMAEKVLAIDRSDGHLAAFYRELKDRAVRTQAFLDEAFKGNKTTEDGVPIPDAGRIPDAMLEQGIASVWNDVALVAWPTIVADLENPPAEEPMP